ncbi:hypothetical protein PTKIN_Ptkin01aG0281000 [Pterospermum kingtungense]
MIDLSKNKLVGKIPRSLMECRMLEYIDLGNNQINDAFPSWLGTLPQLNILILCSNELYGRIGDPESDLVFPKLRIIDLSHNRFHGTLPSGYFQKWNAMKNLDVQNSSSADNYYMIENLDMTINVMQVPRIYAYSMTIANKGIEREYPKIIRTLVAIDLSSNRFEGEIPESVGSHKQLRLLNFSNNNLVGRIPSAIAKLTNLEALDLSQNNLSGSIPWELSTELTFLAVLNLPHNNFTGRIPQGQQFNTFEMSSFDGNAELCGKPLLKECDSSSGPPSSTTSEDSISLDWKVVVLGYGSGFLIGVVIGHCVTKWKRNWLTKTFSIAHVRRPRARPRRRR